MGLLGEVWRKWKFGGVVEEDLFMREFLMFLDWGWVLGWI